MNPRTITHTLIGGLHALLLILVVVMCVSAEPAHVVAFWVTGGLLSSADVLLMITMLRSDTSMRAQKILLTLLTLLWLALLLQTPAAAWIAFPLFFLQFIIYGSALGWLPIILMLASIGYVYAHNPEFPFPASIIGPVIGTLVSWALTAGYKYIVHENQLKQKLISSLHDAQDYITQTERTLAIEQERSKLAADIHDTVAQGLASINLVLSATQEQISSNPAKAKELVDLASETAANDLVNVRQFISKLSVPQQDTDFVASVHEIVDHSVPGDKPHVAVHSSGQPWVLTTMQQQNLLRLIRSTVSNALRHAQADTISIDIDFTPESLTVSISDDGVGFNPHITQGRGLFFAQERLFALQGSLDIESHPGHGTTISAHIPRTMQ